MNLTLRIGALSLLAAAAVGCNQKTVTPLLEEDHIVDLAKIDEAALLAKEPLSAAPTLKGDGLVMNGNLEGAQSAYETQGVSIKLPETIEAAASGKTIRVSVAVRSNGPAAEPFSIAYSTNEVGNSGWQAFEASPEMSVVNFTYSVNPKKNGKGDFIGFLPDTDDDGIGITVTLIGVSETAAAEQSQPE